MVRAFPETAMMLESILNMKITLSVNLLAVPNFDQDKVEKSDNTNINPKISINNQTNLTNLGFGVISVSYTHLSLTYTTINS